MNDIQQTVPVLVPTENKPQAEVWGGWPTIGFGLITGVVFVIVQSLVALAFLVSSLADSTVDILQIVQDLSHNGLVIALATLASAIVCAGVTIGFIKLRRNVSIRRYLALNAISRKTGWAVFGLTVGLLALSLVFNNIFKSPSEQFLLDAYRTAVWPPLFWAAVVIFAPAFEEMFFRGFLFAGLQKSRIGPAGATGLTALAWAVLHIQYDAFGIGTVLVLGVIMGVVRLKTGSLWSTLLMHSLWNLAGVVAVALEVGG
jgi:membrane protease YdiL (CAAX protease family)